MLWAVVVKVSVIKLQPGQCGVYRIKAVEFFTVKSEAISRENFYREHEFSEPNFMVHTQAIFNGSCIQ